jgi:NAD(P)H-dependent FMN reductase
MTTIVGISGSLRRGSYNTSLLRAAAQLMPNNAQLRLKPSAKFRSMMGISKPLRGFPNR